MSQAPQYRCHKIVTALPIIDAVVVNTLRKFCVQYGDKTALYLASAAIAVRYSPVPGDMLVFYTDESFEFVEHDGTITLPDHLRRTYVSISPKAEFDAGYSPLASADVPNPPLDREAVRRKLEEALLGKTDLNQTEQHCAVLAAVNELHTAGVIRQPARIAYHVPTKSWTVAIGTAVYAVNAQGCIGGVKS